MKFLKVNIKWFLYGVLSIIINLFLMNLVNFKADSAHSLQPVSLNVSLIRFSQAHFQPSIAHSQNQENTVLKDFIPQKKTEKSLNTASPSKSPSHSIQKSLQPPSINKSPLPAITKESQEMITEVIYETKYRRQSTPVYPRRSIELGQQGKVILHVQIKPNGLPQQLKIVQSSGYTLLDMAAFESVKTWEFEPISINDPSEKWVRVPINFVIKK